MIRQRAGLDGVPDFCNDIPIGFHGGVWIRILELSMGLSPFNHAFIVTQQGSRDREVVQLLQMVETSEDR